MAIKKLFRLNLEGVLQEVYTTVEYDKVYFKFKGLEEPVGLPLEEFTSLVSELPQVLYSIKVAIQDSYADYMEDMSGMMEALLKERKKEEE